MRARMRNETTKEQEFLAFFDAHADGLFSRCFSRVHDLTQAHELVEKTFKRGWDQIVEGGQPRIEEFHRLLDELVNARISARGLAIPALFEYFLGRMNRFS